jgi:GT2 family glycosyltransferase
VSSRSAAEAIEPIGSASVVLPVLNAATTLGDQLAALSKQDWTGEYEVIVADNGSTDRSGRVVAEWVDRLPKLRVVDASDRRGANHARNVGGRAADGALILVCDADDVVEPGWISAMVRAAEHADVLGGAFEETSLNDSVSSAWRPSHSTTRLPTTVNEFLPFAVSANCAVRTDVFRALGGWSEDYMYGGDDVEFSWRAQLHGYRLAFVPDAIVRYRYRSGLRALFHQFSAYGMAESHLYRDFRGAGAKRRTPTAMAKRYAWLVAHVPDLARSSATRGRWVRAAAFNWGRLRGSVKYRTLYL